MEKGDILRKSNFRTLKKVKAMKKLFAALILMIVSIHHLSGQVLMNKDSLLRLLPGIKDDTAGVQLYIDLGQQYESNEPETAKMYYRKAGELSRKINYPKGIIKYISNYTFVLNMQGLYDSSLILNLQAVDIAREIKDSLALAKTLFNAGTSYRILDDYENAVKYYEAGKKIFEKFGNERIEAQSDDILQLLYYQMKNYKRAIEYGENSVATFRKLGDQVWLGASMTNLGMSYVASMEYEKAEALFREALKIGIANDDKNLESSQYLNLGNIYLQRGDYETMKPYMEKALKLARQLDIAESEAIALRGLSFYYTYTKNYQLARILADSALAITYSHDFKSQRVKVLTHLSNLAYAMQNMKLGEQYALQSELLNDSILNESILKHTQTLEKQYETEKKEAQIHHLSVENQLKELKLQRKSMVNYSLIGGILVLIFISILLYRNFLQKQVFQEHRISELETEKQLAAAEAVLKGEEQERTRLARDLHDGLGGLLTGIKYSFTTMKGDLIMTPENHQAFERSLDMLDSSIKEMRRVAHNMMPETLVRFGLNTALKDFCNDINQSGALKVNYQSIGLDEATLEKSVSITLYRIVQELLNNILKHAGASNAIVQINKTEDQLSVTVEDDGKGFNTEILNVKKGIGWVNIQNRVEFLKGKFDIESQSGEGTSVHMEFKV